MKPGQKLIATAGVAAATMMVGLVTFYEGKPPVREGELDGAPTYQAYRDPIGIVTACMGHTRTAELGRQYTEDECNQLLSLDLLEANATVERCVRVSLSAHERAAYASFAFNVGPGRAGKKDGFCTLKNGQQPTFLRRLNAGDRAGACRGLNENGNWTYAGGAQLRGLVRRRADERALCEGKPQALRKWGIEP